MIIDINIRNYIGTYARFTVNGKGGAVKKVGCWIGVSYIKKQYKGDGNHGHHAIPKNVGGNPSPAEGLIFLPAETHRMFHFVFDVVLKNTPELEGKGNWTSQKNWSSISRTRRGRKLLYEAILNSSKIVDRFCKLKAPNNLTGFVRRGKKDFLAGAED